MLLFQSSVISLIFLEIDTCQCCDFEKKKKSTHVLLNRVPRRCANKRSKQFCCVNASSIVFSKIQKSSFSTDLFLDHRHLHYSQPLCKNDSLFSFESWRCMICNKIASFLWFWTLKMERSLWRWHYAIMILFEDNRMIAFTRSWW